MLAWLLPMSSRTGCVPQNPARERAKEFLKIQQEAARTDSLSWSERGKRCSSEREREGRKGGRKGEDNAYKLTIHGEAKEKNTSESTCCEEIRNGSNTGTWKARNSDGEDESCTDVTGAARCRRAGSSGDNGAVAVGVCGGAEPGGAH